MKKFFLFSSLIVFSFLILSASYVSAADKIGFIGMREVMARSDAGKAMEAEFKKAVEEKRTAIQWSRAASRPPRPAASAGSRDGSSGS